MITERKITIQATVTVSDPDGKITGQSKSRPNNLILDNFGSWLAGFIRAPVTSMLQIYPIPNHLNVDKYLRIYENVAGGDYFNNCLHSVGTLIAIGSGNTPATRADYHIETAFGTAPEDDFFGTGNGSYAGGVISFSGAITAGGAGTINEVGLYGAWDDNQRLLYNFMLFHDILTSGVAFSAGQTITVAWAIQL